MTAKPKAWTQKSIGSWWSKTFHGIPLRRRRISISATLLGEAVELCIAAGCDPESIRAKVEHEIAKGLNREVPDARDEAVVEEIADVQVAILALSAHLGLDLESEVSKKMIVNLGRAWRPDGTRDRSEDS